ncbi:hypothetical protein [Variovorax sp. Sphag1AA]|uniref:hypothetical protein n=1 Tax=Variovorax sp. Sphag1AA TaxID=2587027 RepID=UPI0016105E3D|nr:hypothetical protein [Variovorax sp. Sphag1AA]MBB3181135.1 hypothetical protein [Variovorax sp. Sphag1AA]
MAEALVFICGLASRNANPQAGNGFALGRALQCALENGSHVILVVISEMENIVSR